MKTFKSALVQLWREEEGLTVVEYAVAGGLIAAGVIAAFTNLGHTVNNIITYLNAQLATSPGSGAG